MPFVPIVKESHQSMSMLGADYAAGASGLPTNKNNPRHRASANAQSIYGNQAVLRMLNYSTNSSRPFLQRKCGCHGGGTTAECEGCSKETQLGLQTKLRVSEPGDAYEQEADRVADQVLAAPSHHAVNSTPPQIGRASCRERV